MNIFSSPWLPFWGILADLIGFSILALDLIPKYKISRTLRDIRSKLEDGRYLEDGLEGNQKPKVDSVKRYLHVSSGVVIERTDFSQAELKEIQDVLEWNKHHGITENGYRREKLRLNFTEIATIHDFDDPEIIEQTRELPFNRSSYLRAIEKIEERFLVKMQGAETLNRPPVVFAIILIIIGFILQLIGSIP